MSFKFAARLVAAVLGLFVAAAAQAEIIAFEFRGKLTYSTYMAPVGTPIVGRFGWDAATPPGPPMMPG